MGSDPIYLIGVRPHLFLRCARWPLLLLVGLAWCCAALAASADSPLGLWRTIDDKSAKPRSVVRIFEEGGRLFGRIERGFDPRENERTCNLCTDERRDQPLRGMLIIRNMKRSGDEYVDGDILDPDNGSVYRSKMRLEDEGRKLSVRGFIGVSLFGRSQTWEREQ